MSANTDFRNVLLVTSSPNTQNSVSTSLATRLARGIALGAEEGLVIRRDVGANPPPVLDGETIGAFFTPADQRTDQQKTLVALSDTLVDELEAADAIVIAAPMHNFSVTGGLKTWFDQIARIGRTFQPTGQGPKGLITGKPVYVITTRGGAYGPDTDFNYMDQQIPFLKTFLGFIGLTDITVVYAEGTSKGDTGIKQAEAEIDTLIAAGGAVAAA